MSNNKRRLPAVLMIVGAGLLLLSNYNVEGHKKWIWIGLIVIGLISLIPFKKKLSK